MQLNYNQDLNKYLSAPANFHDQTNPVYKQNKQKKIKLEEDIKSFSLSQESSIHRVNDLIINMAE